MLLNIKSPKDALLTKNDRQNKNLALKCEKRGAFIKINMILQYTFFNERLQHKLCFKI